MKPTIFRSAILAVVLAILAPPLAPPGFAGDRERGSGSERPLRKKIVKEIAPGLVFTKLVDRKIPRRIFVLRADLSTDLTFDVTLARGVLGGRLRTSEIATRFGAIAAVNGDFTDPGSPRPVHPMVQDGGLVQTSLQRGVLFGVSRDEERVHVVRPDQLVTLTLPSGLVWVVDRWNQGPPGIGEIAAHSPLGGTLELPPRDSCSVRLLPAGPPSPSDGGGTDQAFTVDERACAEAYLPRSGGVVLSAVPGTGEATQLMALEPGARVSLHWTVGLPGNVWDAIGGNVPLVVDGEVAVGACDAPVCRANPRTGIGLTAEGKLMLVVVDGRRPRWSYGLTLVGFARLMQRLGAVQAVNLDGGGASTMVVNGEVVNRPANDGAAERTVASAVLVLPGPDPGEPS